MLASVEDAWGELCVSQQGNDRVLSFGSSLEQSRVDMQRPWMLSHEYTQIMLLGLLLASPQRVTVLGLGGGGLAHCLTRFYPQVACCFVELRQAVIDIAYEWFALPRRANLEVICAEALQYLAVMEPGSSDLILSDLYDAGGMNESQSQLAFVESCHRALSSNGWLVVNFHHLPAEDSQLMSSLSAKFEDIRRCDVFRGNHVLFCGKTASTKPDKLLQVEARQLARRTEMPMLYYSRQLYRYGNSVHCP